MIMKRKKLLKDYITPVAGYKLYVHKDFYTEKLLNLCLDIEGYDFDWQQNSKCSKFAKFEFDGGDYYVKKLKNRDKLESFKTMFKGSRAFREFRGNKLLQEYGVKTPLVVAMLENNGCSYMITKEIKAIGSLKDYLKCKSKKMNNRKAVIAILAEKLAKLHSNRIVLGDLNMNNILVEDIDGKLDICILDNERTRQSWGYVKGILKNLVQLNKFDHSCATSCDRLRFFKLYSKIKGTNYKDEDYLKYVANETKKRREKSLRKNNH